MKWILVTCAVRRLAEKAKRRKLALAIGKKLEIIKSIDAGSLYTVTAEKYDTCIAWSMIANTQKDVLKVKAFKKSMEMGFQKATSKTMKTGEHKKLDKALCMYICALWLFCVGIASETTSKLSADRVD